MVKNPPANARDMDLIPASGRSAGEGNGNPLLYFCLGNHTDREAWWATVLGVANGSDMTLPPKERHKHLDHNSHLHPTSCNFSK